MTPHKPLVGIYPTSTVKDVAESLSTPPLSDAVSAAIAGDVEYRLNLIIQEAEKFMRHGKRRTMEVGDVEMALGVLNVAPLLHPPAPLPAPAFAPVYPSLAANAPSQLYYLQTEEIDLPTFIRQQRNMAVQVPVAVSGEAGANGKGVEGAGKGVDWKAHWLAVEGVQPLIRENPAPIPGGDPSQPSLNPPQQDSSKSSAQGRGTGDKQKYSLPMELQLLFQRLTSAIVPDTKDYKTTTTTTDLADSRGGTPVPANATPGPSGAQPTENAIPKERTYTTLSQPEQSRLAALQTLSTDPGLVSLLPSLIRWHSENIQKIVADSLQPPGGAGVGGIAGIGKDAVGKERIMGKNGRMMLGWLIEGLGCLSGNEGLFIEPYVHQFLPPLMSILVSTTIGPSSTTLPAETLKSTPGDPNIKYSATVVRKFAADLLGRLMGDYGKGYDTLIPRITKTLLQALHSPPPPPPAPKEMDPPLPQRHQPSPSTGRYEGALLGLRALGEQVVVAGLFGDGAGGEAGAGGKGGRGVGLRGFGEVVGRYGREDGEGLVELTLTYLSEVFSVPRSGDVDIIEIGEDEQTGLLTERFGDVLGAALGKERELGAKLLSL